MAQAPANPDWLTPIAPFHIAGNLYYVGSKDLASYLVVTPQGHILINPSFKESVPLIRASVEQLGFKFKDIKILLISHSHGDHDAGGATDFEYATSTYEPAKVDRVLHDGDEVKLGRTILTAHKTARSCS